ncbi:MAG: glycogen synthase GlgA [Acidobacteria bacterium]|nr:glycogen synthase GlgA [Acidobacteriota bacterium]
MRVAHITSEAVPFAKTGGLADVAGALPAALAELGHKVWVVMPLYRRRPEDTPDGEPLTPDLVAGGHRFTVWRRKIHEVTYLLLDAPRLFERAALYGTADGDYEDNPIRFAAFCRAAVLAVAHATGGADLLHCHDWQTALIPQLAGCDPVLDGVGAETPTVLTIHNLAYQGSFEPWAMEAAGLPRELNHPAALEFYGRVNFLKGGILAADALTTVSPTYAREILTPERGCGLDSVLATRSDHLVGILNGLDTTTWDPGADPHLVRTYTGDNVAGGKAACRAHLARALGLDDDDSPIIGIVSRLADQKGLDVVAEAADGITAAGYRLAVLGTGDPELEAALSAAAARHPRRTAVITAFDDPLAHRIYAGADLFLMPSRFEPCGLGQLIALRYGALPIVNPTGGLADTVRDLGADLDAGNGFRLPELSARALLTTLKRATAVLNNPLHQLAARRRAMAEDHGWQGPAEQYEALYASVLDPTAA